MATPIVSRRGASDVFLACFTWQDELDAFCQVDCATSLSHLVDRADAWLGSGRQCVGVEIWLGTRLCVFVGGASGDAPNDLLRIGFPLAPGVYRWQEEHEVYAPLRRRERRAL